MIEAITKIDEFVGNMNFEDFIRDDKTSSAVIRKLEIISEATKHLPRKLRDRFKEIPWSAMAKTRDKIIHFYHGVDYEIVWKTIKEDLPLLKPKLTEIYELLLKEERKEGG